MATTSSKVLGTVTSVVGEVRATASDGTVRIVQVGDKVFTDEVITTSAQGNVNITLEGGRTLECGSDANLALSESILGTAVAAAPTPPAPAQDVAALQAAIAAGADPTQVAEATAAGAPGAGGADGSGGTPVVIDQANPRSPVSSGFDTSGANVPPGLGTTQQLPHVEPVVSLGGDVGGRIEGTNGGEGNIVNFVISLDHAFNQNVTVSYQVVPGTAQTPSDYTGVLSDTVTIPAGQTEITISISITQDHFVEANETFSVVLTGAVNATIDPNASSVVVTIIDDDLPPVAKNDAYSTAEDTPLTVAAGGVLANDTGAGPGETLTVTSHTNPSHGTLTLNSDGSLTYMPAANYNGADSFQYSMTDGYNGTSTATVNITVTPVNDAPVDGDEAHSFTEDAGPFTASGNALANASDVEGDALTVSAGTGNAIAGAYGTLNLAANGEYTYTLNNDSPAVQGLGAGQVVTDVFNYTVSDGHGGTDASQITITITGAAEAVTPSVITPPVPPPPQGPDVIIGNASATEGEALVFDVALSNASSEDIVVNLMTVGGTATDGVDYENGQFRYSTDGGESWTDAGGTGGTQVTIPAGLIAIKVEVASTGDEAVESNESFTLKVGSVVSGAVDDTSDTGTGTINDNDSPPPPPSAPDVSIGNASATEGEALVFDVVLSNASSEDMVLDLMTGGGTATDGVDYENGKFRYSTDGGKTWIDAGGTGGTEATIPAGLTAIKVEVDSTEDETHEPDESFTLKVGSVVSGAVDDTSDTGAGLIIDDDGAPVVSINNITIYEGAVGGPASASFTISIDRPTYENVTVDWSVANVTASPDDYIGPISGTATIVAGTQNMVVSPELAFTAVDDEIHEPAETFTVTLDSVSGGDATGAGSVGTGTIVSDDPTRLDIKLTANTNQDEQLGLFTFENGGNTFTSLVFFDKEGQQGPTAVLLGFGINYGVNSTVKLQYIDAFAGQSDAGTGQTLESIKIKDFVLGEDGANVDIVDPSDGVNIGIHDPTDGLLAQATVDMNDPSTTADAFGRVGDWTYSSPVDENDRVTYDGTANTPQDGGAGIDILDVTGASLDLTALGDAELEHFEVISLKGSDAQTLKLSVEDVLEVTDGQNVLHIIGGKETVRGDVVRDTVDLSGSGWTVVDGNANVAGIQASYFGWVQVNHTSGATLLVDPDVHINIIM